MIRILLTSLMLATSLTSCNNAQQNKVHSTPPAKAATQQTIRTQTNEVNFNATDGQIVFADLYISSQGKSGPLIILFHQAGANGRGEYQNITTKLVARGYSVLQVDQRSGGNHFGNQNRTAQNRTVKARGKATTYCPAYADMEGALSYVKTNGFSGARFAWGSSYSAALSLKLAGEHGDDLAGVLSFSPASGSGMGACAANQFIPHVKIPALGLRPRSEMNENGQAQKALYDIQGLSYFISEDGVHGASMLDPNRAKGDVAPTWKAVYAFLEAHK
ncbi:MAG: hypothetical protein COA43_12165 [Robiginitomaculum sp.]|nr:MAG: hypothetical protein COA43_12165 [Robiginitomaculum sp.]